MCKPESVFEIKYVRFFGSLIGLVWFDLGWFYGISTIVCYLMPNPFYTWFLNTFCK